MSTEADLRTAMNDIFEDVTNITCSDLRRMRYACLVGHYEGLVLAMATNIEQREMVIKSINQHRQRYIAYKEG